MKKKIIILLAILLLSAGCTSNKDNAVTSTAVKKEMAQTVDTFGVVKSNDIKDIYIDFPVLVENILVKEGQKVKKGDALIKINYEDYKSQIKDKETELKSLMIEQQDNKFELAKLKSDLAKLQNHLKNNSYPELKKLANDLKNSKSIYDTSVQEFAKMQKLFDTGAISKDDLKSYEKSVNANQKAIDDVYASIEDTKYDLQKEVGETEFKVKQKDYDVEIKAQKIKNTEDTIKLMKDKIVKAYIANNNIVSDLDNAIICDLGYVKGETTDTTKKLFSLMNLNSVIVQADVPEEFIKDIKLGSAAKIIPQADKSIEYIGKITYISNKGTLKNGETTVLVEASIDDRDEFLLPDFNVDLKIDIRK